MNTLRSCLLAFVTLGLLGCGGSGEPEATAASDADVEVAEAAATPVDQAAHVQQLYQRSCFACHSSGTAGAPLTGDQARWGALIDAKGMDGLVASAIEGIGGMPPKGLCAQCTEADFALLIEFMAKSR